MEKERFFKNLIKVSVGLIVAKCFYLQIIRYPYYSALSKKNCIRTIELDIPRGKIFDRNGRILAEDKPCFNLVFIPYDLENPVKEAKLICKLISVDKKRVLKIISLMKRHQLLINLYGMSSVTGFLRLSSLRFMKKRVFKEGIALEVFFQKFWKMF